MSIRQDYKNAYGRICADQRDIVFSLYEIMEDISDQTMFERLKEICNEHTKAYNTTKKYFDSLNAEYSDHRTENRENILGLMNFKEENMDDVGMGKCLDISAHGARVKFEEYDDIMKGERFKLWIRVFGNSETFIRNGIIQWVQSVDGRNPVCGIRFQP